MKKSIYLGVIVLSVIFISFSSVYAEVWYVDNETTIGEDGVSWISAFDSIQEAIDAANDDDEIWVKEGTYALTEQINVNKSVSIYGGFDGTEDNLNLRDWENNVTTVDGQDTVRDLPHLVVPKFVRERLLI